MRPRLRSVDQETPEKHLDIEYTRDNKARTTGLESIALLYEYWMTNIAEPKLRRSNGGAICQNARAVAL
jgi:hypothetical protein